MVPAGATAHHRCMAIKLLIVEDSEPIRTSLLGLLAGIEGITAIHTAGTLAEAFDCMRRELPALVILDLQLPDGNAMHHIHTMKTLSPLMWIAVLTNNANNLVRDKCLQAGASWFFDKSTEFEKVLDVVHQQATLQTVISPTQRHTHA